MTRNRLPIVTFIGVTGIGKTTQAREFIRRNPQFALLDEKEAASTNNFLALSYEDPKRYSFHSQIHFLLAKAEQLLWAQEARATMPIVQEPAIYQDGEMYARARLWGAEYGLYKRIYKNLLQIVPKPDLIVYLRATVEVAIERIEERAKKAPPEERPFRETELLAPRRYWERLHELHEKWVGKKSKNFEILTIEVNGKSIKKVADEVSECSSGILSPLFPRLH